MYHVCACSLIFVVIFSPLLYPENLITARMSCSLYTEKAHIITVTKYKTIIFYLPCIIIILQCDIIVRQWFLEWTIEPPARNLSSCIC